MAWLKPTRLVEKCKDGFFKLNNRNPQFLSETTVDWNDVEYPKIDKTVLTDQYRISKLCCLFEPVPEPQDLGILGPFRRLKAIQLHYENVEDPTLTVRAPINGVKLQNTEWTVELELRETESIIGMQISRASTDLYIKTNERIVCMKTGEEIERMRIWTMPPGFRLYGFHGTFDKHISFIGPVFKVVGLKSWNADLYHELPQSFKKSFEVLLLTKLRHRHQPPKSTFMYPPFTTFCGNGLVCRDFWTMPEVAWDRVVYQLLCGYYLDMDINQFFTGLEHFHS